MKKSLLYLFAFICIQLFTSWIVSFIWHVAAGCGVTEALDMCMAPSESGINGSLLIAQSAAYCIVAMAVFMGFKWSDVSPAYLRSRQWGVFFWCVVASLGAIIPTMWLQELMPALPDTTKDLFAEIMRNDFGYITLCIFAPLVEELVFRGAILRALLASMPKPAYAIIISALLFSMAHINPAQMPHAFLVGLLLGWTCYRTGSILPGVAFHWTNNTVVYMVCRIAPYMQDMTITEIFKGSTKSVALATVFSLLIIIPALYQLNMRMRKA